MIQWNFDRDRKLIRATYTGIITFEDIQHYINELGKIENLPSRLKILSDFTEADSSLLYRTKNAAAVMRDIKSRMGKYELVKEAVLQNNPVVAALATLYLTFFSSTKNYKIKIFSTQIAAMEWLEF